MSRKYLPIPARACLQSIHQFSCRACWLCQLWFFWIWSIALVAASFTYAPRWQLRLGSYYSHSIFTICRITVHSIGYQCLASHTSFWPPVWEWIQCRSSWWSSSFLKGYASHRQSPSGFVNCYLLTSTDKTLWHHGLHFIAIAFPIHIQQYLSAHQGLHWPLGLGIIFRGDELMQRTVRHIHSARNERKIPWGNYANVGQIMITTKS